MIYPDHWIPHLQFQPNKAFHQNPKIVGHPHPLFCIQSHRYLISSTLNHLQINLWNPESKVHHHKCHTILDQIYLKFLIYRKKFKSKRELNWVFCWLLLLWNVYVWNLVRRALQRKPNLLILPSTVCKCKTNTGCHDDSIFIKIDTNLIFSCSIPTSPKSFCFIKVPFESNQDRIP